MESQVLENLLTTVAYRMLAMYSKKSDHAGPFSGCISAQPRTSMEVGTGRSVKPMVITSSISHMGVEAMAG